MFIGQFRSGIYKFSLLVSVSTLLLTPLAQADHTQIEDHRGLSDEFGTSGSSIEHVVDKARVYCYTGTLGALVERPDATTYILSNNHVLAKENEPDNTLEPDGMKIIQPGLLDEGPCSLSLGNPDHQVGYLEDYVRLEFGKGRNLPENTVDAAIALNQGMDPSGRIMGIGGLSGNIEDAVVNMPVQKSGRTTGHTFGTVAAINVTLNVSYDSGTARFTGQTEVVGTCMNFSAGGDSGALIVTVPDDMITTNPPPPDAVGLLFAGGGSSTFANPIGDVLSALNVTMVASTEQTEIGAMVSAIPPAPCTSGSDENTGPGGPPPGKGKNKSAEYPAVTHASEVATLHSNALLAISGAQGHGIGVDENGDAVIRLYMDKGERRPAGDGSIPAEVGGVRIVVVQTGKIRAY